MAFDTFTHTGKHLLPDGSPAQGTIEIIPSERLIVDQDGNAILSGRVKVQLDEDGAYSVDLPDPNDASLTPFDFGYTVAARLHHTHLPAVSFGPDQIASESVAGVLDITDVTSVDPSTFEPGTHYGTTEELEAYVASAQAAAVTAAASATSAAASAAAAGGGSSSLTVVDGGVLDLDNTEDDGYLVGYRLTDSTLVEGVAFEAGSYIFERDSSVYGGWTVRTLDAGAQVVPSPDSTAPTAPNLSVDNSGQTQLVATFSGGTDAVGVTQYRSRIDGGPWTVGASPRTFTGLLESTSHTIDVQAGDAAGNWSASASWAGSTASAGIVETFVAADGTDLVGRVPTSGTTDDWEAGNMGFEFGGTASLKIVGNKATDTGAAAGDRKTAALPIPSGNAAASIDFALNSGSYAAVAVGDRGDYVFASARGTTGILCYHYPSFEQIGSTYAPTVTSGNLSISVAADLSVTVKLNGSNIITGTRPAATWTDPVVGLSISAYGAAGTTIDNLTVVSL